MVPGAVWYHVRILSGGYTHGFMCIYRYKNTTPLPISMLASTLEREYEEITHSCWVGFEFKFGLLLHMNMKYISDIYKICT